jgi:recombination protein RecT
MTTQITTIEAVRLTLTKMQPEFSKALPAQIPSERFIRTVMTAVQIDPKLVSADRGTLLSACMRAAQDGLIPDGREAALVAYGDRVQYMPMITGILKKLRQSGLLMSISANVVYERDQFDYELGDEERIQHKPFIGDRGRPIAVYAIARTTEGGMYREVMSFGEIESIRNRSRAGGKGPWVTDWAEMARKTVIRRLAKRMPSSADLDSVFAADNDHYEIAPQPPAMPVAEATPQPRTSRLKASLAQRVSRAPRAQEAITVAAGPSKEVSDAGAPEDPYPE